MKTDQPYSKGKLRIKQFILKEINNYFKNSNLKIDVNEIN